MSRTISRRLLAQSPFAFFTEPSTAPRLPLRSLRSLSSTPRRKAGDDGGIIPSGLENTPASPKSTPTLSTPDNVLHPTRPPSRAQPLVSPSLHPKALSAGAPGAKVASLLDSLITNNQASRATNRRRFDPSLSSDGSLIPSQIEQAEAHHFHIYATRHNTHITVTRPDRSPLISVSAGNIGFRHAGRKHYDSAFQLASYVLGRMNESGLSAEIKRLEVVLRGFGAGREAVTKALLGTEGRFLRNKVIKVADATRLKFGGTRSKKPRRLG